VTTVAGIVPLPPPDEAFPSRYPFLHTVLDQVVAKCQAEGVPAYGTLETRGLDFFQYGHLVPAVHWQLALAEPWPRRTTDGRTIWACCVSRIGPPCHHRISPAGAALAASALAGYSWAVQQAIAAEQQAVSDRLQEANDALPTHLSPMPGVRRARRGRHLMGPRKMGQGGWLRTVFGASPKGSPVKHKGCFGNLWLIVAVATFGLFLSQVIAAGNAVGG
jgi:hypothetical protein